MAETPDPIVKVSKLQDDPMSEKLEGVGFNPDAMTRLKKVVQICQRLRSEVDFRAVGSKVKKRVSNGARDVYNSLEKLSEGTADIPRHERELLEGLNEVYEASGIILANAYGDTATQYIKQIEQTKEQADIVFGDAEEKLENIKSLEESAREAAQAGTVSKKAKNFSNQAWRHRAKSYGWLLLAITIAVGTGLYAYSLASNDFPVLLYLIGAVDNHTINEVSIGTAIQNSVGRVALLSVLFFGLVTCIKSYRSEQHNYVVNEHRANALMTFEVFVDSTENQEIKNAVLLQTTEAIFSPQQTGFKPDSSGQQNSLSTNFTDIVQNLSAK